jgi:hypothetical protein
MSDARPDAWTASVEEKTKLVVAQLGELQRWVDEAGGDADLFEAMSAPYRETLRSLYEEDFPVARVMDRSDLFVHVRGPAVDVDAPKVSVLANLFVKYRTQVTQITRVIAKVAGGRTPPEMDLGFAGFAPGSLYLGFRVPTPEEGGFLPGIMETDPLYQATREAVRALGTVSAIVSEDRPFEEVEELLPDPMVRDTVLAAVQALAPSPQSGIDEVAIGIFGQPAKAPLTPAGRRRIRDRMRTPVSLVEETGSFVGVVREIDLDLQRFELRRLEEAEVSSIRCVYEESRSEIAITWVDQRVRITGGLERDRDGTPKLLWAEQVDLI